MVSDLKYVKTGHNRDDDEEDDDDDEEVRFRILVRKDAAHQTEFAKKAGLLVTRFYEEYFDELFPIPKQDMVALPDFSYGAMENWGLITYR